MFLIGRSKEPCRQGPQKGCSRSRETGQIHQLQPQSIGYSPEQSCRSGQFCRTVEHDGEAKDTAEAGHQPKGQRDVRSQPQGYEIEGPQPQDPGHAPAGQRGHQDDQQRIGQPFQARAKVQLGQVDAAGNEREPGDQK